MTKKQNLNMNLYLIKIIPQQQIQKKIQKEKIIIKINTNINLSIKKEIINL